MNNYIPVLSSKEENKYYTEMDVDVDRCPLSLLELEDAIRYRIRTHGRVLRIHIGMYNLDKPVWMEKVVNWLYVLAEKYQPWQFRIVRPSDKYCEVDWVETDCRLHKYGGVSVLKRLVKVKS